MPIPFECECGKKMSAKEDFAGRKLRCPECQRVLTIPVPGSSPSSSPSSSKVSPGWVGGSGSTLNRIPPLTPSEANLDVTRPTSDTRPPSRTMPTYSPEDLPGLLAPLGSSTPMPTVAPKTQMPAAKTVHPWVDQSFQQTATQWRSGDEDMYQYNVRPAREWEWPLGWAVPLLFIAVAVAFLR